MPARLLTVSTFLTIFAMTPDIVAPTLPPLSAPDPDSVALVSLNRQYVDAFIHGRADWYERHLAPEFEHLRADGGITTRGEFVAAARVPMTYRSFLLDSVRVKRYGSVALVTAINPFERADGSRGTSRYTDVWVKRDGEWRAVQAQISLAGAR